jgi:hypothetical protein
MGGREVGLGEDRQTVEEAASDTEGRGAAMRRETGPPGDLATTAAFNRAKGEARPVVPGLSSGESKEHTERPGSARLDTG